MTKKRGSRGPVPVPDAVFDATDEEAVRARRERQFVAEIEARLRAGELTMREADEAITAFVLEDFDFLSEGAQAELRAVAEADLNDCPELVESRPRLAARYGAKTGDEDEPEEPA